MSGATVYTWSNFGKVAAGEEIAGGSPEDPLANLVVAETGITFLRGALGGRHTPDTVRVSRTRSPGFCFVTPYGELRMLARKPTSRHTISLPIWCIDLLPVLRMPKKKTPGKVAFQHSTEACRSASLRANIVLMKKVYIGFSIQQ